MEPQLPSTQGVRLTRAAKRGAAAVVIRRSLRLRGMKAPAEPPLTSHPQPPLTAQPPPLLTLQPPLHTKTVMLLSPPYPTSQTMLPPPSTISLAALTPPCTKSLAAPKISPASREQTKRKLRPSAHPTPIETRARATRRVNRRLLADPSFDALGAGPPPIEKTKTLPASVESAKIQPVAPIAAPTAASIFIIPAQLRVNTTESLENPPALPILPPVSPLALVLPSQVLPPVSPLVSSLVSSPLSPPATSSVASPLSLLVSPPASPPVSPRVSPRVSSPVSSPVSPVSLPVEPSVPLLVIPAPLARAPFSQPVFHDASDKDALTSDEDWRNTNVRQLKLASSKPAPTQIPIEAAEPVVPSSPRESEVVRWTAHYKRETFTWILQYLHTHLEIGFDEERVQLTRYLESPQSTQGLFVSGASAQSTGTIIRSLLNSLNGALGDQQLDVTVVKGELYSSSEEIYSSIRARLKCKWDFPPWRRIHELMQRGKTVPPLDTSKLSVVVLENIDPHVKEGDSKQPALDRLLRFLNAHVLARGLKLIVIGHEPKTVRRFSQQFGGFSSPDVHLYVLRLPQYSFMTLAAHIEAVITRAIAAKATHDGASGFYSSPPLSTLLNDLFAPKVIQFAAQKALKQNQCELDPVLAILRRALVKMLSSCRYRSAHFETDASRWRLRYEHVAAVTADYFKHDYVHRIQCVGVIPQTVLLVLIDSGPCTEEQLFERMWERRLVHSWVMVVTTFRKSMFDPALELLLSVPVVKKRETTVLEHGVWRVRQELHALPTREHLIAAAGNEERIKLLL